MYTAILTAAGYSSRMGNMKALLPWHGTSLILHQISILRSAGCEEIVVVVGPENMWKTGLSPQIKR